MAPASTSDSSRLTCCRQYWTSASTPVRLASVLRTVASCLIGLIWTSGVPNATRSPDLTKIWVTTPSTSGWTVDDRNERIVAMKPDVCSTGFFVRVIVDTPIAGGAPAGGPPPRVQALATIATEPRRTATRGADLIWKGIAPEG